MNILYLTVDRVSGNLWKKLYKKSIRWNSSYSNFVKETANKTMKICGIVQKKLFQLGVGPNQRLFNKIQLKIIFEFTAALSSLCLYLVHTADTPEEYVNSIFITLAMTCISIGYFSITVQTENIFLIIDNMEQIIENRKLN